MKRYCVFITIVALCLLTTACGGEAPAEPDELQTPQYSVAETLEFPEPEQSEIHTSEDGVKVISPGNMEDNTEHEAADAASPTLYKTSAVTPESIWENDDVVTYNAFTLPEKAAFDNGSLGLLTIPKIGLTVNVYESDNQMEDMDKGAAHFKSTSAWDGNIALSAHNMTTSGYCAYFKDLHVLAVGDIITYETALGEREYQVTTVKTINDDDWSYLSRTTDNRLTLVTCVNNNASKRLLVQAAQK